MCVSAQLDGIRRHASGDDDFVYVLYIFKHRDPGGVQRGNKEALHQAALNMDDLVEHILKASNLTLE
ncbi:hypothetical protein CBW46_007605 [Paenibacillus xerothermodurans]|uniref:Uncharacterized protein n=1 Tax=Paenibacillus xerothermodurans TaxID=1977292 RepID=A0A2W1NC42_PAEXE|nr:hypothetical protein CBW46_007605 [Paenibacillus xerothermodurans]